MTVRPRRYVVTGDARRGRGGLKHEGGNLLDPKTVIFAKEVLLKLEGGSETRRSHRVTSTKGERRVLVSAVDLRKQKGQKT